MSGGAAAAPGDGSADALQRILDVLRTRSEDRSEVRTDFARVALRRVAPSQLAAADPQAVAQQLDDAFDFIDRSGSDEIAIRIFQPKVALDGWSEPGTAIEVCTIDRPFLLSTVTSELSLREHTVVRNLHPILGIERGDDGRIQRIISARQAEHRESLLHVELDDELDPDETEELKRSLERLVRDTLQATGDYHAMRDRTAEVEQELRSGVPGAADQQSVREAADLLAWLRDDNFVFLGAREYEVLDHEGEPSVRVVPGSGLGVLSDESGSRYADPVPLSAMEEGLRQRFLDGRLLLVSRTNRLATVRRRVRMDYVGVKRVTDDGRVVGEFRLVGLFTRKGYAEPARSTPVLRRKLQLVLEREDIVPGSHDERMLTTLFQALPKDELFQTELDDLHETLVGLLQAEEQGETRTHVRTDDFTRTVSILVAVPRDRYSPDLRRALMDLFARRYDGDRVDVDLSLGERADALVRFSVHVGGDGIPDVDIGQLQAEVRALARSWTDDVTSALVRRRGDAEGMRLARTLAERMPRSYRDRTPIETSVADILILDDQRASGDDVRVVLRPDADSAGGLMRLRVFKQGDQLELSGFLPIVESLGLHVVDEQPTELQGDGPRMHIHDFGVRPIDGTMELDEHDSERAAETITAAWSGMTEVDSLNRLVLRAAFSWREVDVLRAYRRLRRQMGTAFTPDYVNRAITENADVAQALRDLFIARFDPDQQLREDALQPYRDAVIRACDDVLRLDHDRILRGFIELVEATLRTDYFQARPDSEPPVLTLKLDPSRVSDVPSPVPYREVFVAGPTVEGVHLRGGPVARGGIRWSDRQDDVRTEVLGLMKAQMLKNAVIVPTGAKGGFVLKRPPADPAELRAEVERQYVRYIRALLAVTDNLVDGEVIPPENVLRRDDDDPYLVVAADKGTATFSDTANAVATEAGFWLGDAFASGGSQGYDHKKLGITARGAWVAVRQHFRELGLDVQTEPFTVVGIGDMSGDVFGNGMLSSRTTRLVAAFDHRDVFLDPDPDPEAAFEERQRLFRLPRSSWQDYDRDLISTGGGVFSRSQKSIPLSAEVRDLLGVDVDHLSAPELIRAILRAPVDLLFAGGIGTYVKASSESNDQIGDRANDELRVDANQVRARVIGEGANLAVTQAGRVQYARRGGRVNMDAIDNAAGVDISDHEVNCKILLRRAIEDGDLSPENRDSLLEAVTDDVVAHVLQDVDLQVRRLSQEILQSPRAMDGYDAFMLELEATGLLERAVEFLPSREEFAARVEAGAGLTRPELAVLMGYAKRVLTAAILVSDLPDDPALQPTLATYFPGRFVSEFRESIAHHQLRRELVATIVANDLVNRMGITFPFRVAADTASRRVDVIAAYWAAREVAGVARRWVETDALIDVVGPDRQLQIKSDIDGLIDALTRRYAARPGRPDITAIVQRDRPLFETLEETMLQLGTGDQRGARAGRWHALIDDLVEPELAQFVAATRDLAMTPDVSDVMLTLPDEGAGRAPMVADAFLHLSSELSIDRVRRLLERLTLDDKWSRMQQDGLMSDLLTVRSTAVATALSNEPGGDEQEAVKRFLDQRGESLSQVRQLVRDIEREEAVGLDSIGVAVRAIDAMVSPRGVVPSLDPDTAA